MNAFERFWWPLVGVGLAALLASNPVFERVDAAWQDFSLRQLARPGIARSTLVLDIDETSLEQLRQTQGDWPLPRALHAKVADRLLNSGAKAVVFNLMFEQARSGDDALRAVSMHSRQVVFGAGAGRPESDTNPPSAGNVGWPDRPDLPATRIDGLRLPDVGLWPDDGGPPTGLVSVRWAEDGVLRCLPLLYRTNGRLLPALPVAAMGLGQNAPRPGTSASGGRIITLGDHSWPTDARACVPLRLPTNADAVPALPYSAFAGVVPDPSLDQIVNGRTVFIGSPSLMDPRVMTPVGQVGGTQWQALAHEALQAGWWIAPTPPWHAAGWLTLALLPAVFGASRATPRPGIELVVGAVLATLLVLLAWVVQAGANEFVPLPAVVLLLVCGALASGWRWQRWLTIERQRARAEKAAAEASNRAKSEFLAQVSHEIRTPLNAVLGMAQLLAETPLTSVQQRYVDVFASAGHHLQQLIEDMLDLSRVEARRLELCIEPFGLRALVDEIGALFDARARARGLTFGISVDAQVPEHVLGDSRRLRQVLVNLLGNALKFTHEGSVTMQVGLLANSLQIEFVVRDTGVGIAPERLAAVFEPFTQASRQIAAEFGGTGLGLSISRHLIEAMHGTVQLQSEPGAGTEVRVRLPLPACEAPVHVATAAASHLIWSGRNVLIAEDHPHNIMVLEGMLADRGLVLDIARDGSQAIQMAGSTRYDIILMDIQMPVLDGLTATREIRKVEHATGTAPVPILALSANAMPGDAQASLAAGCDGHLAKPIEKSLLLATLAAHLGPGEPSAGSPMASTPRPPPPDTSAPVLDTAPALERLGGDSALFARVCKAALNQLVTWETGFDVAAAAGDQRSCRRLAHDLKSVASTIGAMALRHQAEVLEQQLASDRPLRLALDDSARQALRSVRDRLGES